MKRTSVLAALLLTLTLGASAQATQYVNTWVKVKAVPEGKGTVTASFNVQNYPNAAAEIDVQSTVPTSYGSVLMLAIQAESAKGSTFGGVYIDDGDGLFDPNTDQLFDYPGTATSATSTFVTFLIPSEEIDAQFVFDDDLMAGLGAKPNSPQFTLFVNFSEGAVAEPFIYSVNDPETGTVSIQGLNQPGGHVSLTAIPNSGFAFDCWTDANHNVVSTENPLTFDVEGGEHYYANFYDVQAPVIEFPKNGGWKVLGFNRCWYLPHYSNNAYCIQMLQTDLYIDPEGRTYAQNMGEDGDGRWGVTGVTYRGFSEMTYSQSYATVMWGKGTVRLASKTLNAPLRYNVVKNVGYRDMIYWSTGTIKSASAAVTRKDENGTGYYAYVFNEQAGAFIQYANTDWHIDPDAPTSVTLPKDVAYLWLPVQAFVDGSETHIPKVIGLSPESYELGMKIYNGEPLDEPVTLDSVASQIRLYVTEGSVTLSDITKLIEQYSEGK